MSESKYLVRRELSEKYNSYGKVRLSFLKICIFRHCGYDVTLALIFGLLMGMVLSVAQAFYATVGTMTFNDTSVWLRGIAYGLGATVCIFALLRWWAWFCAKPVICSKVTSVLQFMQPWRLTLLFAGVATVVWIPALLAYFPGGYSSDGPIQATYYLNDGVIDLHWPAAHTLLLVAAMQVGNILFSSYDAGVTLFCATQMLVAAAATGYATNRMLAWGIPSQLAVISFAIFVLNPVVQTYVVATVKDTLFAVFFLMVIVLFVDALRGLKSWTQPGFIVAFVLCALGMTLMRKQGLYVLVIVIVIAVFVAMRGSVVRICALTSLAIIYTLSVGFSVVVASVFEVRPDSVREMLSLPSQQIVRTYMYDYDTLSEEQIQAIGRYYNLESLEAGRLNNAPWDDTPIGSYYNTETSTGYFAPLADPAKGALFDDTVSADLLGYVQLYFSLMAGHELRYVQAFLWSCLGYLYPSTQIVNEWLVLTPWNEFSLTIDAAGEDNQVSDFHATSLLPSYLSWLEDTSTTLGEGNRLLTLWVCPALPFYMLLLSFLLIVRSPQGSGRRFMMVAWLFLLIYGMSLMLAPVVCLRYAIPLIFCIPVIIGMPFALRAKVNSVYV